MSISDKIENTYHNTVSKVTDAIDRKVDDGKVTEATAANAVGAAQIAMGLARGAGAVAGLFGHGLAGLMGKRLGNHAAAAKMIKEGFEAAEENIREGFDTFGSGRLPWRK